MISIHPMEEYINALVTCELAMMIARKYKEPVNKAVSHCAKVQSKKCTDSRNAKVFLGVSKSESSAMMIYQFRTMLDEEPSK